MRKNAIAILAATMLAVTLGACSGSASFSQFLGDAKAEIKELEGTVEGDFDLPYTNVGLDVELESGSIDIEIVDVVPSTDDEDPIPLDVIYEAHGLGSGTHLSFTDDDGAFILRIMSEDKATGTITLAEEG